MRRLLFCVAAGCVLLGARTLGAQELPATTGNASYYGAELNGNVTASGETFNMDDLTAAHRTLPFNTLVRVTNLTNGKSVVVRINDRGPFVAGREIDVSRAAAERLDMLGKGVVPVSLQVVPPSSDSPSVVRVEETPFAPGTAPAAPESRWDIQVGAYADKKNAQAMAYRLSAAGFAGIAFQTEGSITRVVLRDLSADEVRDATVRLSAAGFTDYLVKRRTLASGGQQ